MKVGTIVRYRPEWSTPEERKYLHLVKESVLNPVTGEMSRWIITTLNTKLAFQPTECVEEYMIEPTGFTVDDL